METAVSELPSVRLSPVLVEIPATARADMRVPARVWADEELWQQIRRDRTLWQLVNVATLPGIVGYAQAMPDAHEGYGFPVGGVAAFRAEAGGIISPGGVGYDINCGVRLLASELDAAEAGPRIEGLVHDLMRTIPSGVGRRGRVSLSDEDLEGVLTEGAAHLLLRGQALPEDLEATEAGGSFAEADPGQVSERARERGRGQLGTLGSGNHFLEVQVVDRVLDPEAARVLGLREGQLTVLIHSGSRGLGHQVCTDWVKTMDAAMARYGIALPDRELACTPFASPEGRAYFGAMCAAANFAFANRQTITHLVRRVFERALGARGALRLVYDVAHNMAKVEDHGGERLVAAKKVKPGHEVRKELEARGIVVRCPRSGELAEEAPHAYKDVDRVVDVVHRAGLARRIARLTPLGVVKG